MSIWNKVINNKKIIEVFNENIDFHDAEITKIKYDGTTASIEINCEGFIKTFSLFNKELKKFKNIIVYLYFENVSKFEIDYNYGLNLIDELCIEENDNKFTVTINSYYLKIICNTIKVDNIIITYKKQTELLDKYLKSNI